MTNSTIATLITVNTLLTRLDSCVPRASSSVKIATITTGPQSKPSGPIWRVIGISRSNSDTASPR